MHVSDPKSLTGDPKFGREIREVNGAKKQSRAQLADRRDAAERHSRIPWSVGTDRKSLKDIDLWVYFALVSEVWSTNVSTRSTRWIAKCVAACQSTVVASLKRLEGAGHIEIMRGGRGKKAAYLLLSPTFGERDSIVNGKTTKVQNLREARKPTACGRCGERKTSLGTSGICRGCLGEFAERMRKSG